MELPIATCKTRRKQGNCFQKWETPKRIVFCWFPFQTTAKHPHKWVHFSQNGEPSNTGWVGCLLIPSNLFHHFGSPIEIYSHSLPCTHVFSSKGKPTNTSMCCFLFRFVFSGEASLGPLSETSLTFATRPKHARTPRQTSRQRRHLLAFEPSQADGGPHGTF